MRTVHKVSLMEQGGCTCAAQRSMHKTALHRGISYLTASSHDLVRPNGSCSTPAATLHAQARTRIRSAHRTSRPETQRPLDPQHTACNLLAGNPISMNMLTLGQRTATAHFAAATRFMGRHNLCAASGMPVRQTLRARSLPHAAAAATNQTLSPPQRMGLPNHSHAVCSASLVGIKCGQEQ